MKRVVIEHPYSSGTKDGIEMNEKYGRACLADSLDRDETPFSSALLYAQEGVLDDTIPQERAKGIQAGFKWREVADKTVFYGDRGISGGMLMGLEHSIDCGIPVTFRSLGEKWQIDHPPKPGAFDEREALAWLRVNPSIEWRDNNRDGWMNHMTMMFGGTHEEVSLWNFRDDGSERYILHRGRISDGTYFVDAPAVFHRLCELI